ncbi:MAG: glycosyltransferase [Cyanobacteria bacterium P01_D01_bin.156]
MKVAFLLRKFPVLSETFILEQIVALLELGVEVDIYALLKGDNRQIHPLTREYRLLQRTQFPPLPCPPSNAIFRLFKAPQLFWMTGFNFPLRPQLKSLNILKYKRQAFFLNLLYFASIFSTRQVYDIIHCHFGMYGLLGVDLKDLGLIDGKVITSFHGIDIHVYPKQCGPSVYQRLFNQGDFFTVNSDFTKDCLIRLGCPENKITKLPVGLRTQLYSHVINKISTGIVQLLTVARLTEKKGIEYSIRAVYHLYQRFPNIRYDIVGEGPLQNSLTQLISDLNAESYIHLVGLCNQVELRQRYANTDIFILASITATDGDMEGQGLVLQEAQASGIPVISTWHNGIPEGILVNQSGFLVPERDVEALTERLAYLIAHPKQRQQMGATGQTFVRHAFDINNLNQQLLNLYENLL